MISIRQRLTRNLLVCLLLVVAVCGGTLYAMIAKTLRDEFDAALLAKARTLTALALREPTGTVEFEFSEEMIPAYSRSERPDYFQFWFVDGRPLHRSKSLGDKDLVRPAHLAKDHSFSEMVLPDGQRGRAVMLVFAPGKDLDDFARLPAGSAVIQSVPRVILMLAQHRSGLDRMLRRMLELIVSAGLFLPLMIALVVWLAVKKGLRPLDRLARETEAIDFQNLGHRFQEGHIPRELQPIGHQLNALIERLEQSFKGIQSAYDRERRFNDNVAHELRTPIAELHSLAEVALLFPRNREMSQKAHRETMAIARQMENLVAVLSSLTRYEAGIETVPREPVDLAEVIRQVWENWRERAAGRAMTCQCRIEDALTAPTHRIMLVSILDNLVSNAVDHGPAGGQIEILGMMDQGRVRIAIRNTNSTLVVEDLENLFEPFWQKDASRADNAHSGLGLSLVNAMCRVLGIDLATHLDEANIFSIDLLFREDPPAN